jgi:hypothetical protein
MRDSQVRRNDRRIGAQGSEVFPTAERVSGKYFDLQRSVSRLAFVSLVAVVVVRVRDGLL